ncbi:MAG: AAA family ATPase [Candidatus Dormibacteria bacterium]
MRLERLDIAGFGRLRGMAIDFSPRLTVIVGGNESGKSTIHRAVRASLYGLDAGGQGRAVERSPWNRWMPWTAGAYGVALSYTLNDGSRFRVARRLDQRGQTAQVQEIGGRDVTADMRIGRLVAPGQVHLGIDEAVFCATAWLGDDGLLATSPDAPGRRLVAARLQEALERLADTGRGVTAAGAVGRLREAMARIGSERRSATPLGVATARMRQLDLEIAASRRREAAIASDEARLVDLESASTQAAEHSLECERAWLLGRLAQIAVDRSHLAEATRESTELESRMESTRPYANFPLDDEDRVIALGGELHQAEAVAGEARSRADAAAPTLHSTRTRRAEVALLLEALGTPISLDAPALDEARSLEKALAAEGSVARRVGEMKRAEACCDQLRRQVAATGLGSVPAASTDSIVHLFQRAMAPRRRSRSIYAAVLVMALTLAVGLAVQMSGHSGAAPLAISVGTAAAAVVGAVALLIGADGRRARRELGRRFPGLDASDQGLEIAASRLPMLQRLQEELRRLEILVEAHRCDIESARGRAAELSLACAEVVEKLGINAPPWNQAAGEPRSVEEYTNRARASLAAVREAVERRLCWDQLNHEDEVLTREESATVMIMEEATRRAADVHEIEERLRRIFTGAGLPDGMSSSEALAAFRAGCEGRRRHDEARTRLSEVRRRIEAIGSDEQSLGRRAEGFTQELRERGVDASAVAAAVPLQGARLDVLEREATHARRVAASAAGEAAVLRARLGGAIDSLPNVAALADERASCAAARERGLSQLAALERAITLIEQAARYVHRDLAPRLAQSVAQRLCLITDGRYRRVNVDTEHFAVSLFSNQRCELVPLELVSRGTRDQVSLLLRLGISELLAGGGEAVPLLLDEPLLTADSGRTGNALDFIAALSESHQVVMTTSDASVAEHVQQRLGESCSVARLEGAPRNPSAAPVEVGVHTHG